MAFHISCLALGILVSSISFAQELGDLSRSSDSATFKQQGKLFTLQIVPGEPMRFFVVGKEEAKLDISALALTVRRLKPYPGKILRLDRKDDFFVVENSQDLKDATLLEVTAQTKTKSETLRVPLDKKP